MREFTLEMDSQVEDINANKSEDDLHNAEDQDHCTSDHKSS